MENFLIIRLSSLGDIIHTLPSLAALRKKFPKASISWIVEEKGKEILECVGSQLKNNSGLKCPGSKEKLLTKVRLL